MYSKKRDLLYVGITKNRETRFDGHNATKTWWGEVDYITVEHYDSRWEVETAEKAAIAAERPRYNINHNKSTAIAAQSAVPRSRCIGVKVDGSECKSWPATGWVTCASHRRQEVAPPASNPDSDQSMPRLDELIKSWREVDADVAELLRIFSDCFGHTGCKRNDFKEASELEPFEFARRLNALVGAGSVINIGTDANPFYVAGVA